MDPSTAASLYSAFESWRYFNVMLLKTPLAVIKAVKIVKNQDGGL